jgi:alginate O-acetyltransferase complex protein AlgI
VGLVKKVLIADQLAPFVDRVFADPSAAGGWGTLLAVYAYAVQIYCDFSGYTDIGRGCAFAMGYTLPSNFNDPYFACNVSDFWRRWHITLSLWLRDYLYIPLGGSRGGEWATYRNLILTMTLGGLWHGASLTFVVWGLYHGVMLAVNRLAHNMAGVHVNEPLYSGRAYRIAATVATFHAVCLGWIFFRAPDFATAFAVLNQIGQLAWQTQMHGMNTIGPTALALVVLLVIQLGFLAASDDQRGTSARWLLLRPFAYSVTTIAIILATKANSGSFIYFQF